tara:strand:+ start:450 stop:1439 length:990 start_codon:yes stop_codon:yes gene_type:complete
MLQADWDSQSDTDPGKTEGELAYSTARTWVRKEYDCTGGRAQWLTGGSGGDALDDIVQTVICHTWELFVNGSLADPNRTVKERINASIALAKNRVVKQGRLFRPADRNPSAGHQEACKGRLTRTTYEGHEGAEDDFDLVQTGIAWGADRDDEKAYRVPENHDALDRLVSRITAQNCKRHSGDDCRSYRKMIAAMIASDGNKEKAAEQLDVPVRTFGYRLHHVADALRQVLAIGERKLKREHVAPAEHVQLRCWQTVPACLPRVAAESVPPTSAATGGPHERYPVPTAKRWADKLPAPVAAAPVTRETVGQILARQATIRAAYDRHVATR